MYNLLKMEFYKLWRQKSFWGILILIFLLGNLMTLDRGLPTSALNCFLSFLYNVPIFYFFIIIFSVSFIGESFETRMIHTCISEGHKRMTVLSAKMISFITACIILLFVPLTASLLTGFVIFGFDSTILLPSFFAKFILIFFTITAMSMLPFFMVFLFKDLGKSLTVPIVMYFLFLFLLNSPHTEFFSLILPMGQIRQLSLNIDTISYVQIAASDILWCLLCYIGAAAAFYRSDLK